MLDDFETIDGVLSFGIGSNSTWEEDIAKNGVIVEMYDPTVDNVKPTRDNMFFYKIGVSGKKNAANSMDSLENILDMGHFRHADNLILKMDVEGCEWDVIPHIQEQTMKRFKQIVFEFHGMTSNNPCSHKKRWASLEKLNKTHQLVHIHANNVGEFVNIEGEIKMPEFLEATYLNKSCYTFTENKRIFPTEYDAPNISDLPEIILGKWH